jgi:hypothetical protein
LNSEWVLLQTKPKRNELNSREASEGPLPGGVEKAASVWLGLVLPAKFAERLAMLGVIS